MMTFFSQITKKHPISAPKNPFLALNGEEERQKRRWGKRPFPTSFH